MEVKVNKLENSEVEIHITASEEDLAPYVEKAWKEIAADLEMPGFRKGSVTVEKAKEKIGEDAAQNRASELAVDALYRGAIEKESLRPIAPAHPEIKSLYPLDVIFKVTVYPAIELADIAKIQAEKGEPMKEEEIEKRLTEEMSRWQEYFVEYTAVEREARDGDRVEIDFEGKVEGKPLDGGSSKNHPLVLGSNSFIPGFEEQLLGVKAGDEKLVKLTFPAEYHAKQIAGKEAEFAVKVHKVEEKKVIEWGDELLKKVAEVSPMAKDTDLDGFKAKLREGILNQDQHKLAHKYESDLVSALGRESQVEVPKFLVDEELGRMLQGFEQDLTQKGVQMQAFLDEHKMSKEDLSEKWRENAARIVKERLCLSELVVREKLTVSDEEVAMELEHYQKAAPQMDIQDNEQTRDIVKYNLQLKKAASWLVEHAGK